MSSTFSNAIAARGNFFSSDETFELAQLFHRNLGQQMPKQVFIVKGLNI